MRRVSRPKARLRPSVLALVTAGIKRLTFVPRTHARIRLSLRERSWIPSRLVPSCGLVVGARRSIVLIRSNWRPSRLLWRSCLLSSASVRVSPLILFAVWASPWATRVNILRRVAFVIKLPLRLHPVRRALSAVAFLSAARTKSSPYPSVLSRRRVPVRFSTASRAKLSGCIFPPLMRTSILVCFAMPSSAAAGVPTKSWLRS